MPASDEIAELQQMLVTAVLGQKALPGSGRPIVLPDLNFVVQENGTVSLSDENLLAESVAGVTQRRVKVLNVEGLRRETDLRGQLGYLRFQPADVHGDLIRLTLEGRVARQDERDSAGLSGVQATFVKRGGQWRLEEEPTYFAA